MYVFNGDNMDKEILQQMYFDYYYGGNHKTLNKKSNMKIKLSRYNWNLIIPFCIIILLIIVQIALQLMEMNGRI